MSPLSDPTSQWLRGVLDLCLLASLRSEPMYGYEMTRRLAECGLDVVSLGSIYPALARLERDGHVEAYLQSSPEGPARKYYRCTDAGVAVLLERSQQWSGFTEGVRAVLNRPISKESHL